MIIHFSKNYLKQIFSILRNNLYYILFFVIWSCTIYFIHHDLKWEGIAIPMGPVTLLGGGLAFFLGFRNNSAYDRWWEARKIWGGIVNISRTMSAYTISFNGNVNKKDWEKSLVYGQLAWINALRIQLREEDKWNELKEFLDAEDFESVLRCNNKASYMGLLQSRKITTAKKNGWIDSFEHKLLMEYVMEMYKLQGMAERIKKTVFPYFYHYFTRIFLWLFVFVLPSSLVAMMGWHSIPLSVSISFVFYIMERTGVITENPLDKRSSGTPMNSICRAIEIDLKQQLNEQDIPEVYPIKETRHGSVFID